ncbi:MAG: hypothetical protein NT157_01240, partial [Candidatus Micrarchaeota archaeon]|nr:hypothetical protein [Candidatus Micrarchaeota archaeon]
MDMKLFTILALVLLVGAAYASNSGGQGAGNGNGKEGNGVSKEKKFDDYARGYGGGGDDTDNGSSSCGRDCASVNGTCLCGTPVPVILKPVRITVLNPANKTVTRACPWFCDRSDGGCDCSVKVQLNISFNMTNQTFWKSKNFCNCSCYFGNATNTTYPCQLQNCSGSNVTTCSCLNGTNCTSIGSLPCLNLTDQNLTNCSCSTISNYTCSAYNSTCQHAPSDPANRICSCSCIHPGLGNSINKLLSHRNETGDENNSDCKNKNGHESECENETNKCGTHCENETYDENETNAQANRLAGILERARERVRDKIENAIEKNNEKIANMLYKLASKIEKYTGNRFGLVKMDGDATLAGQVDTEGGPAFVNVVTYKRLPTWAIRERLKGKAA